MRWTVLVALSATVLSFGLGFGVGANLGAASATRLVVEKVLSLRDRFLACSGADIDMDTIFAWWSERYWRVKAPDWPAP
jgi:hypothetical protein